MVGEGDWGVVQGEGAGGWGGEVVREGFGFLMGSNQGVPR